MAVDSVNTLSKYVLTRLVQTLIVPYSFPLDYFFIITSLTFSNKKILKNSQAITPARARIMRVYTRAYVCKCMICIGICMYMCM